MKFDFELKCTEGDFGRLTSFPRPMLTRFAKMFRQPLRLGLCWLVLFVAACVVPTRATGQTTAHDGQGLKPILDYISTAWDTLTRSMTDCQSLVDPKLIVAPVLYLPAGMADPTAVAETLE